jgi:hypothetical protein
VTEPPTKDRPAWQGDFSFEELCASIPFDNGRRMRGAEGSELFEAIVEMMDSSGKRVRARRAVDEISRNATIEAFLANLIVAAFNRIDAARFVAVPFATSRYTASGLSPAVMRDCRDVLGNAGMLEGVRGFKRDHHMPGFDYSRHTRLRATPTLRHIFESCGVDRRVAKCSTKNVIRMNHADSDCDVTPPDVRASEAALIAINYRLETANIALPDQSWQHVAAVRNKGVNSHANGIDPYAGDLTALSLYRVFTGNWKRGGRLYGGWWMHLPKAERSLLTIDGEATAELDFGRLHPTLLYAREGLPLNVDPYSFNGHGGDQFRNMGKRTFSRLINSKSNRKLTTKRGGQAPIFSLAIKRDYTRIRANPEDIAALPTGMTFAAYVRLLTSHIAPIARWFGSDTGLTLQREDSDLAMRILSMLDQAGIVALPIHDSFIVKRSDVAYLRMAMTQCFKDSYSFDPIIMPTSEL